ncbi:HNH endonuclease [Gordonia tangerina]|uniref:HNH endonuclease n=1 Tax=Gordonia tangerina TaxID=2911060 RepID=A0ABS9DKM2_9ACTN|nr:HNH endonuclease [Gordonia tangerina]MCF3938388.1 HNH endonuclease [Gordonia tangerina]
MSPADLIRPDGDGWLIPDDWRYVPGTQQRYAATPDGDVVRMPRTVWLTRQGRSVRREYRAKVLKQSSTRFGHKQVGVEIDGTRTVQRVHRLICAAFHGPSPSLDKRYVLHGDGDPANNRPENLRWGTAQENSDDAQRHGGPHRKFYETTDELSVNGPMRHRWLWSHMLTFDLNAFRRALSDYTQADVSAAVGRSGATVSNWMRGKTTPQIGSVHAISQWLGIPMSTFYEDWDFWVVELPAKYEGIS